MRRLRGRGFVVWTLVLLAAGVLLATLSLAGLYSADQACFLNYPSVPCPGSGDATIAGLTLAFVVIPSVWLIGICFGAFAVRVLARLRHHQS